MNIQFLNSKCSITVKTCKFLPTLEYWFLRSFSNTYLIMNEPLISWNSQFRYFLWIFSILAQDSEKTWKNHNCSSFCKSNSVTSSNSGQKFKIWINLQLFWCFIKFNLQTRKWKFETFPKNVSIFDRFFTRIKLS